MAFTKNAGSASGRPLQHVLRLGVQLVVAAHPLQEEPRSHNLNHILGHVVGAHADATTRCLQLLHRRRCTPAGGDGGVVGSPGPGLAQ